MTASEDIVLKVGGVEIFRAKKQAGEQPEWLKLLSLAPHIADGVSIEHLKRGHTDHDNECSVCNGAKLRDIPHRRTGEVRKGVASGDLFGPVKLSLLGKRWGFVVLKMDTLLGLFAALAMKLSMLVREAAKEMKLDWRTIWRYHSDGGREFFGEFGKWRLLHECRACTATTSSSKGQG